MDSHCYGASSVVPYSSYPFAPSFLHQSQPSPFPHNQHLTLALHHLEAALMSTDDDPTDVAAPPAREDPTPHSKFCHMAVLGAIAEACGNDSHIHIVDFRADHGAHWAILLQALAARPGGPPRVCFTMIDNCLRDDVGKQLEAISMGYEIPVVSRVIHGFSPDMTRETLGVRPWEALAVNLGPGGCDPDGMLRVVKSLEPRVVTVVEDGTRMWRLEEVFEWGEVRDGLDWKRAEVVGRWPWRMEVAGFKKFPVSGYVNSVMRRLLGCYSEDYEVVEEDGAVMVGWKGRTLISASAWH